MIEGRDAVDLTCNRCGDSACVDTDDEALAVVNSCVLLDRAAGLLALAAELPAGVRARVYGDTQWTVEKRLRDAAEWLEAAESRIAQLEAHVWAIREATREAFGLPKAMRR